MQPYGRDEAENHFVSMQSEQTYGKRQVVKLVSSTETRRGSVWLICTALARKLAHISFPHMPIYVFAINRWKALKCKFSV